MVGVKLFLCNIEDLVRLGCVTVVVVRCTAVSLTAAIVTVYGACKTHNCVHKCNAHARLVKFHSDRCLF
jgi:hypothetical protein